MKELHKQLSICVSVHLEAQPKLTIFQTMPLGPQQTARFHLELVCQHGVLKKCAKLHNFQKSHKLRKNSKTHRKIPKMESLFSHSCRSSI